MQKQLQEEDEISLKELIINLQIWWKYLLSKWLIILTLSFIGGSIGLLYAFSSKPVYIAELSFVLEEGQSGQGLGGSYSGLASIVGIDLGGSAGGVFAGDNLIQLMKSRYMVEKTLLTPVSVNGVKKTLAEFYIDINNYRKGWEETELKNIRFLAGEDRSKFSRPKDSLLLNFCNRIISNNLLVGKKDKKIGIITITVRTSNELFSKYFAETIKDVVSGFYIDTKTQKTTKNISILEDQVDSIRRELNAAITGVAASADINPNPNPLRLLLRVPSQKRQIDIQTSTAILQALLPNLEASKVALRKETPLIQEIDRPIMPLPKEHFGKLKGLILGGIIGGFLAIVFLISRRVLGNIMSGQA